MNNSNLIILNPIRLESENGETMLDIKNNIAHVRMTASNMYVIFNESLYIVLHINTMTKYNIRVTKKPIGGYFVKIILINMMSKSTASYTFCLSSFNISIYYLKFQSTFQ